jgi:hypothetical protein
VAPAHRGNEIPALASSVPSGREPGTHLFVRGTDEGSPGVYSRVRRAARRLWMPGT